MKDIVFTILYNVIIIYIIVSFIELFLHKYIMHGDPKILIKVPILGKLLSETAKSHHDHHKQVLMNMHYIDQNTTNGFKWDTTLMLGAIFWIFFTVLTDIKNKYIILTICTFISVIYSFLWNTIHNQMHFATKTITISEGVPSLILDRYIMQNPLYRALNINHGLHHLQKGQKYNYNIVFPMFDHLMFTKKYGKCFNNVSYCKKNKDFRCKKQIGCIVLE